MLGRVKRWVLAVLAMLARKERAARGSVRLRSRRQEAALLTRPARGALVMASGRRASARFARFDRASGGSNKGLDEESKEEKQKSA